MVVNTADETLAGKQISAKQQQRCQAKVFLAIFHRHFNRLLQRDRRVSQELRGRLNLS